MNIDVDGNVSGCVYLNDFVGNIFNENLESIQKKLHHFRYGIRKCKGCYAINKALEVCNG